MPIWLVVINHSDAVDSSRASPVVNMGVGGKTWRFVRRFTRYCHDIGTRMSGEGAKRGVRVRIRTPVCNVIRYCRHQLHFINGMTFATNLVAFIYEIYYS